MDPVLFPRRVEGVYVVESMTYRSVLCFKALFVSHIWYIYRLGPVNSKSFVGKDFL